jgi:hypothetical protein
MEMTLYREGDLALTEEDGQLFLRAGTEAYRLASHPYEPCTCLYRGDKLSAVIHNAFTAEEIASLAKNGGTTRAVTGSRYDIGRVCRLLAFAAERCPDCDISYAEGAVALEALKNLGALSPETAVSPSAVGVRKISDAFSHAKKRKERVMVTEEGKVYVRIKG